MSYFIPSFLQKRILRYILAKLEILDVETLDLDKLEISWGKTSSIELKDVGIHLHKAASLLHLPPDCHLRHASLRSLRITIPANLHQSGILIDIEGFTVKICLEPSAARARGQRRNEAAPESKLSSRPLRSQSQIHDPGGSVRQEDEEQRTIPQLDLSKAATHLAESYLDEEKQQNKEELQSALQSQLLDQSLSSDADPEESPAVGVGGEISLPAFLASFIEGVLDRMEVLIDHVQTDLSLHISVPQTTSSESNLQPRRDEITLRLSLDRVHIEGVESKPLGDESLRPTHVERNSDHSRRVTMRNLQLRMLSVSSIFSRIAQSSIPSSPTINHFDFPTADRGSTVTSSSNDLADQNPHAAESLQNIDVTLSQHVSLEQKSLDASSLSKLGASMTDSLSGGRISFQMHDDRDKFRNQIPSTPNRERYDLNSASTYDIPTEMESRESHSTTISSSEIPVLEGSSSSAATQSSAPTTQPRPGATPSQAQGSLSSASAEDLTESKLFTHDEAVSMYMSALDELPQHHDGYPSLPGAWQSASAGGRTSASPHASTTPPNEQTSQVRDSRALNGNMLKTAQWDDIPPKESQSSSNRSSQHVEESQIRQRVCAEDVQIGQTQRTNALAASEGDAEPLISKDLACLDRMDFLCPVVRKNTPGYTADQASPTGDNKQYQNLDSLHSPSSKLFLKFGNLDLVGDMTLTKTILFILQELGPQLLGSDTERSVSPVSQDKHFQVELQQLRWRFVDRISSGVLPHAPANKPTGLDCLLKDSEVLLKATIKDIVLCHKAESVSTTWQLGLGKCIFGYAQEDILYFDSRLKMRESVRDTTMSTDSDVSLSVKTSTEAHTSSFEMNTLPLKINLDLRKLDETFGWFGGLSSVLELGNSVAITITPPDLRGQERPKSTKQRAVHFEPTNDSPVTAKETTTTLGKLNIRTGGIDITVHGEHATIFLKGSALKIVARPEGLGIQIDRLRVMDSDASVGNEIDASLLDFSNIRLEHLQTPREIDLARLIELVFPSQLQEEDQFKDGLMVDTLLRQRRQGNVVRVTVDSLFGEVKSLSRLQPLATLHSDFKKLSTVAKYLPEDDRPGFLALLLVRKISTEISTYQETGVLSARLADVETAFVTFPLLAAIGVRSCVLDCGAHKEVVSTSLPSITAIESGSPVILARFIGNEMIPTVRIRLHDLRFEYYASLLAFANGVSEKDKASGEEFLEHLADSLATLTKDHLPRASRDNGEELFNCPNVQLTASHLLVGLNPRITKSKGYIIIEDAGLDAVPSSHQIETSIIINKALVAVINDNHTTFADRPSTKLHSYINVLTNAQYAPIATLRGTKIIVQVFSAQNERHQVIVDVIGGLLLIESCADSTATFMSLMSVLGPPHERKTESKYRMEAVPLTDLLASFTGKAYIASDALDGRHSLDAEPTEVASTHEDISQAHDASSSTSGSDFGTTLTESLLEEGFDSVVYPPELDMTTEKTESLSGGIQPLEASESLSLQVFDDHFNEANFPNSAELRSAHPKLLQAKLRGFHIIWNLFDGYDWQKTRDEIIRATAAVQTKAKEQFRPSKTPYPSHSRDYDEDVIGDCLFNSIYIGIPAHHDPEDIVRQLNHTIDGVASETDSQSTRKPTDQFSSQDQQRQPKRQGLRLGRSKYHKMTFELKSVSIDLDIFPPTAGETQSALDIRVNDLEIFDHLPSSTWKKFATYMQDLGDREDESPMLQLQIDMVRPVADLAATEILVKVIHVYKYNLAANVHEQVNLLPLRLHVDQDALDFLSRFFEFKDETDRTQTIESEAPFFQRVEVNAIPVKLDFKPKRVDYAGLRSGHTKEFMNFFILDQADMILRHVILYGVSGLDRLGKTLNDIWSPDIRKNQLPGVLAGLGPVRSLVSVGGGVRDLVVIPIQEYRKDGRIARSLRKGALAFAKTTTSEFARLGAKLAIGTQTVLQDAETLLMTREQQSQIDISGDWEDADAEETEKERISLYANQPIGVFQGLRGGYMGLERDLLTVKDAIVAMPGEILESGTASGAARAVLKHAPTVILRPALGVSKVVGQTLMGATNSLDPANRLRMENKYKQR